MKRFFAVVLILLFCFIEAAGVFAEETEVSDIGKTNEEVFGIGKANIQNVKILPKNDAGDGNGYIYYNKDDFECIDENYIVMFVDGCIIKGTKCAVIDGGIFIPLRIVSERLGAEVKWLEDTRETEVIDGENVIRVKEGDLKVLLNDRKITLDNAPKVIDSSFYVPMSFFSDALGAKALYSDGEDLSKTHIIKRIPHIMISRYNEKALTISKEKAVEIVKDELIKAYENRYGEYIPFGENETLEKNGDDIREIISNLKCSGENDRYYEIPVVFDFWVDKYTGDIYVFYNGQCMSIYSFDPEDPGALAFAG